MRVAGTDTLRLNHRLTAARIRSRAVCAKREDRTLSRFDNGEMPRFAFGMAIAFFVPLEGTRTC